MSLPPTAGRPGGPLSDALRLAVGTLSALPVSPPRTVDRLRGGLAMALAPVAVLPLAVLVSAMCWIGGHVHLPLVVTSALAIGALALGSRGLHLDGLADTADGLTASYDRERALTVMHRGDTGPAGAAAIAVAIVLQTVSLAGVVAHEHGWLAAGVTVCCSRASLSVLCLRSVPAASSSRLGATVASTLPTWVGVATWVLVASVLSAVAVLLGGPWWQGLAAAIAGLAVTGAVLVRCRSRLGGVTGDVFGAGIELALVALLVVLSAGS